MKKQWILAVLSVAAVAVILSVVSERGAGTEVHAAPEVRSIHAPTATLVVTNTADSGYGTLRQALTDAVSGDIITFDTAVFPPTNPVTIAVTTQLPSLVVGNVTIDASNAGVIVDGTDTPPGDDGFFITSNGNTIKGLQILHFGGDGVVIKEGALNNTIGGDRTVGIGPTGEGNVISGNGHGVRIEGSGTMSNTIIGNYIGTDASGTVVISNAENGVHISGGASLNLIGGINTTPGGACSGECNLISGNGNHGVDVSGNATMSNTISGNYIGTDASGSAAFPSGDPYVRGIFINEAPHNAIGGATPEERNVVAGGIHIYSSGADENLVIGNYIGLGADGTSSLGGDWNGVGISDGARNNRIGGSTAAERNVISGNGGGSGIYFWSSAHSNINHRELHRHRCNGHGGRA
jgi:hypothetical protein